MLKIGEFSKLSHITVKALRYYEKEKLLMPAGVDEWTGYRYYETRQLHDAARIKSFRQLGMSIEEIRCALNGGDLHEILKHKAEELAEERKSIDVRISILKYLMEEKEMKYQVTVKEIPSMIVYYSEERLKDYGDIMEYIPAVGAECRKLNPQLKCIEPHYEFIEYPEDGHRDSDVLIRHNEAVDSFGKENDRIRFRKIPAVRVLSIFHRGAYENIGEAYEFIMRYAEENGYTAAGNARESYIDGIWNQENTQDWLTEIQLPVK